MEPVIINIYENVQSYEIVIQENLEPVTIEIIEAGIGPQGFSAYQVAVQNGFVGSQDEWLESLKGEKGEKGDPGETDHGLLEGLEDDDHPQYHTDQRGDARYSPIIHTHSNATTSVAGFMSATDKAKLNVIAPRATANDTDANLKARENHTGTQDADTITGSKTSSFISDFAHSVRSVVLSGISFLTGTDVTDSDSILAAIGKLQSKWSSLIDSGTGKINESYLPDSILGQLEWQGTWNASTNIPTIPLAEASNKGHYYVANAAGSLFGIDFNTGDWIVSNGNAWEKVDNTDAVSTVFGRTGAVTPQTGDYTADQISETPGREFVSPTQKENIPSSEQKDALQGTSGTPSTSNKYVTNNDVRLSDARTPTQHTHEQSDINGLIESLGSKANLENGWVDYSSLSTVVGWSAGATIQIRYKIAHKRLFFVANISGTSNSANATFTLPLPLFGLSEMFFVGSGTNATNTNLMRCSLVGDVISIQRWSAIGGLGSFGTSGAKSVYVNGVYEIE